MLQIHYIRVSFIRPVLLFAMGLALVALLACSTEGNEPDNGSSSSVGDNPSVSSSSGGGNSNGGGSSSSGGNSNPTNSSSSENNSGPSSGSGPGGINVENAIKIEFKNGSAPEIENGFSEVEITKNGENIVVRIPDGTETEYNFVLSGTARNGSLKFYGDVRKGLYLNGVNITNSTGPAINIQKSKRVIVNLVTGTQNFLTDGPNYNTPDGEQAKGTFFSEGKLEFDGGSGSLEVKGKFNHAIVADNDFEVKSGTIIVKEAINDGIHANDTIKVKGGNLNITSTGDAIQSEREKVIITGGEIVAQTSGAKSHGIASEGKTSIDGATVKITVSGNGSKGIRSRGLVEFKGGKTTIEAKGTKHTDPADPEDESNAAGIKLAGNLYIDNGELTIKTTGTGAKGINTDGNATISNGKIAIDADDDGIKVHGKLEIKGGTGSIKSKKKKAIDAKEWDGNKGSITTQDGVS